MARSENMRRTTAAHMGSQVQDLPGCRNSVNSGVYSSGFLFGDLQAAHRPVQVYVKKTIDVAIKEIKGTTYVHHNLVFLLVISSRPESKATYGFVSVLPQRSNSPDGAPIKLYGRADAVHAGAKDHHALIVEVNIVL